METPTVTSLLLALLCVVAVAAFVKALNFIWVKPKKLERRLRKLGFPGNPYRFLFGDLGDYSSMRDGALDKPMSSFSHDYLPRAEPFRHHLMANYGKEFIMWFGPVPLVHISKPDLIREAFTKMHEFQKPRFNPILDELLPGLISYEGDQWTLHRRILTRAFHLEKLKLMLPAFYDSSAEIINKWDKLIAEADSMEIDVWPYLSALTADVISRAAFGSSYEQGRRIFQLLKEQIVLGLGMLQSVYFPGKIYIPTAKNRRFKGINDEIQTLLRGIIDKRKQAMKAGEAVKPDLLGILLDSNFKQTQEVDVTNNESQQRGISLQEVIEECKLFYLAGQETTSILLSWTLILLSKYQDWQARAREEILQTFGHNAPDFEGLNHLKTVNMILYEVLRLYPPATNHTRRIYKDTKLGELLLPAGTMIDFPVHYIHRDKELWGEDAEEFKPDRFSEGISKATRGNNAFFPFGGGPRICIGEKFTMIEAKMALSMILQHFSLELSPSYVHSPLIVFFLQPQHGAHIILHRLR